MDLPGAGPALLSALQRDASLLWLGKHRRDMPCVMARVHLCLTLQVNQSINQRIHIYVTAEQERERNVVKKSMILHEVRA